MVPRLAVTLEFEWDVTKRLPPARIPVLALLDSGDSLVAYWDGYGWLDDRSIGHVNGDRVVRWKRIKWHLD